VGLVQSVIEKSGIPTVSISLLREVTVRVRPPRALVVDRPLGLPLGAPHDIDLQRRIVMAALDLLAVPVQEPLLVDFPEEDDPPPRIFPNMR
jgi:D-proline reductase (dithiol) PrdB